MHLNLEVATCYRVQLDYKVSLDYPLWLNCIQYLKKASL